MMNGAIDRIREVFRFIADFLYPASCLLCGVSIPGEELLCPGCRTITEKRALAYPSPERHIADVDDICVLLPYDSECRTLVHALKYHGRPSAGLFFGELIGEKLLSKLRTSDDIRIVPVPLHPAKMRSRGYNQSERIARGIASVTGLTIDEESIQRMRVTPTQTALDSEARAANVSGAFRFHGKAPLTGITVLLVDDVLTTGSTVMECAKALKEGGAEKILVCVAATPTVQDD